MTSIPQIFNFAIILMMRETNIIIPAAHLVVARDNRVLLLRRSDHTPFQKGMYTLVSGKVERGERPEDAAAREAHEETGINVRAEDLKFEQIIYRRGIENTGEIFDPTQSERIDIFFSTTKWMGEPQNMEPEDCDDMGWFDPEDLPQRTFVVTKNFLRDYPNQPRYKTLGY